MPFTPSSSLGPYCEKIFNIGNLDDYKGFFGPQFFTFTNSSIFEISKYRQNHFTWDEFTICTGKTIKTIIIKTIKLFWTHLP